MEMDTTKFDGRIQFNDDPQKGEAALQIQDRKALVQLIQESGGIEISMPCGWSLKLKEPHNAPEKDLLCPCGSGHLMVRYEELPPSPDYDIVQCPTCHGSGLEEKQGGLIARTCPTCKGEKKIRVAREVEVAIEPPAGPAGESAEIAEPGTENTTAAEDETSSATTDAVEATKLKPIDLDNPANSSGIIEPEPGSEETVDKSGDSGAEPGDRSPGGEHTSKPKRPKK